jgi:hypothetical protein
MVRRRGTGSPEHPHAAQLATGWEHGAGHFSEADPRMAGRFAPSLKRHPIAIGEKRPGLTAAQGERLLAPCRELEQ